MKTSLRLQQSVIRNAKLQATVKRGVEPEVTYLLAGSRLRQRSDVFVCRIISLNSDKVSQKRLFTLQVFGGLYVEMLRFRNVSFPTKQVKLTSLVDRKQAI